MGFEQELLNLALYAAQQLGVMLAVGGQTCVLVAYLLAMRDRVIDQTEARFARAVRTVLVSGLGLIVLSGLGITVLHYLSGELATLREPVFIFKWILIAAVILFAFGIGRGLVPQWVGEGFAGATWYALFLFHILAPVTTWESLFILYAGWLAAFFIAWAALVFGTRERVFLVPTPAQAAKKVEFEKSKMRQLTGTPAQKALSISDHNSAQLANPFPTTPSIEPKSLPSSSPPLSVLPKNLEPSTLVQKVSSASTIHAQPRSPSLMEVVLTKPKPPAPAPASFTPPPAPPVHIPMQPSAPASAIAEPAEDRALPVIRVMPKSPEDIKQQ